MGRVATEDTLLSIDHKLAVIEANLTGIVEDFHDWSEISAVVRAGLQHDVFNTGDQLIPIWKDGTTQYECPFDVAQVEAEPELENGHTVHGMILLQHFASVKTCPFDPQEALYDADTELPAGTYHFTIAGDTWLTSENGKTVQFTLTKPIPAGGQLVYANAEGYNQVIAGQKVSTYASPTSFTAIESVTLTEGSGGTNLGSTDASGQLNHHQRAFRGSGRWKESMLRQYLNTDAPAGQWWTKQAKWDRASTFAISNAGYMSGFSADFLSSLKRVKVVTFADTVISGGVQDITYDYFFPLSLEQLNAVPQISGEGIALDYYKLLASQDATGNLDTQGRWKQYGTYPLLIKQGLNAKSSARHCWLRSATRGTSASAWYVASSGVVGTSTALTGFYCAPACVIC